MSYTNADQIRRFLASPLPIQDRVCDQRIALTSGDFARFYGGAIDESSVRVKSIQATNPSRIEISTGSGVTALPSSPLVPGSVVVASDSSLGTIYTESRDYVIDYAEGTLTLKTESAMTERSIVTAWFIPYTIYVPGEDYQLRPQRGEIRRLSGGNITEHETVYLDYDPAFLSLEDDLVDNAVTLANGMIENEVDPQRRYESESALETAATFRALEIVCSAAAGRELGRLRGEDRPALAWLKLADSYRSQYEQILRAFHPPKTSLRPPKRT